VDNHWRDGRPQVEALIATYSRSTQPGHPFVGRRNEYQPKGGMPCGWGVKAGMVRVWVAGKTV